MIGINLFSVIDVLALIISTQVLLVFLYRSVRVTKRKIDWLFTGVMAIVALQVGLVLISDNIVPAGTAADSVPDAPVLTLFVYRLMYASATLLLAMLTHFIVRYAQSSHLRGLRVIWLYVGAAALIPLYFTDSFLVMRTSPLQPTSGWLCAVPWQPDSGPLTSVFIALWLAVNGYLHWLLRRRPRPTGRGGIFDQQNFVWCGIALWGAGGLLTMLLAAFGYAGVDPSMFLCAGSMAVLAIGLSEDHIRAEARSGFIKQVFGRYVTDDVVEKLLESPGGLDLGGERRVVSVMLSDLRGFTALAERLTPEKVVELLNHYLGVMSEVITEHHGTINEFVGDGILAIFGAPIARNDDAENAVRCAVAMQLAMTRVNVDVVRMGISPIEMGIGINTGDVIIGNIGSAKRAKYGVVGSNVNLAARIESATVGGQILVSQSTVDALPGLLELRRELTLHPKGAKEPMRVHDVCAIGGFQPLRLPTLNENWTPLSGPFLLECTRVSEEKQIVGLPFEGRVIAVSESSALLDTHHGLELASNLRMRLSSRTLSPAVDLYGKVVSYGPNRGNCIVRITSVPPEAWSRAGSARGKLVGVFQGPPRE